jgi:hypothetical protein
VFGMTSELQVRNRSVNPEDRIAPPEVPEAHIYLRPVPFDTAMLMLRLETNEQRGRLIGMTERTVRSATSGNVVSGEFVAVLLVALRPYARRLARLGQKVCFETYFEVREGQR